MRFVIGTDEARAIVDYVAAHLREKGHDVKVLAPKAWASIAVDVARTVAAHEADEGIVCCWTGTGVSIAANKVPGVRAALCVDAETAVGARKWNDANVLALSLRLTSEEVAREILRAWLAEPYAHSEDESLAVVSTLDGRKR